MMRNDHHERETLSALFDGELDADTRRFALRRLSHDAGWQADCGRWQLIGDAMRRQAPIAAPADLADRVRRAVAAAPAGLAAAPAVATVADAATPGRRPYRVWAGGALAASVALAAVLATRSPAPAPSAAPVAGPAPIAASVSPPAPVAPRPAVAASPSAVDARVAVADAAASKPARLARTPGRARGDRDRAARGESPAVAAATAAPAAFAADANPFHVPAGNPLSARPWPRATLGNGGALTASYGAAGESRGESPSFFPFEPRVPGGANAPTVDTP